MKRLLVGAAVGMLALMTVAGPVSARTFGAVYANDAGARGPVQGVLPGRKTPYSCGGSHGPDDLASGHWSARQESKHARHRSPQRSGPTTVGR
jgi:hypothetical protein